MTRTHVVISPAPVPPGQKVSTDEKIDGSGNTVQDQIVRIGGGAHNELAEVRNTPPGASEHGLVTREVGIGATTDAATTPGDAGTIQAKLRALTSSAGSVEALLVTVTNQLQDLKDNTDGLEGFVDGLEGLLSSLSLLVDGLEGFTDGIEGGIGASADAAATVGSTGSLTAKLRLVTSQLDAINTKVLTDAQLRASAVPVSGPLTDVQLRATPVPVSGTVTATGGLTDTQLRATPVPVSAAALPLPSGASTETTLAAVKAKTDNLPPLGQALAAASVPVILPAATVTTLTPPAAITGFATEATLAAVAASVDGLEGFTDGIETLLSSISGFVDGLEALVDGLETALGTSADAASATGSLHAKTRTIAEASARSTAGTPAAVTVSTTAVLLKASNAARKAILISNFGAAILYIGHTSGVTASGAATGLAVWPGGAYFDSGDGLYTGDLYGIYSAAAGSQNVSVSERS